MPFLPSDLIESELFGQEKGFERVGGQRTIKTDVRIIAATNKNPFLHLPPTLQTGMESDTLPTLSMGEAVEKLERDMIIDALKNDRGEQRKGSKNTKYNSS
jgi:transcriptional regulator with GAF, ATPase, and Fis domain